MENFSALYSFIDRASRSRKYAEATAYTLKAALKLYEAELNEDEKKDVDLFKKNFEQITRTVMGKNGQRFNASSLAAYKSRAYKVLNDFVKYSDPIAMNSWTPKVINRTKKPNLSSSGALRSTDEPEPQTQRGEDKSVSVLLDGDGWSLELKSRSKIPLDAQKKLLEVGQLLDVPNE